MARDVKVEEPILAGDPIYATIYWWCKFWV